ncbi:MAG: hypothetical protein M3O09_17360 [Acidobacteriota bacterium]|nr:hypothetical protein [Acidobacteriota bacterium]
MEPVTTITTTWGIAKALGEISKKLYDFMQDLKDREAKQHIDEILDEVRRLKHSAWELEDENRQLIERLRFKSDEYIFRSPLYYHKSRLDEALCPKCFAKGIPAPMGKPGQGVNEEYCLCLVCDQTVQVIFRTPE